MSNVITLSVGKTEVHNWKDKTFKSAINKKEVSEILLTFDGFIGDGVANPEFHGGPERAVCFYPYEHYKKWEKEYNQRLDSPAFGENICAKGYTEENTFIGDVFSLGDAVVQVTQGRIPCSTISKFNHIDTFLSKIVETCYTGYFLKVLKEGKVRKDSTFSRIKSVQTEFSVYDATKVMLIDRHKKEVIEKIINMEALALDWKNRYQKILQK